MTKGMKRELMGRRRINERWKERKKRDKRSRRKDRSVTPKGKESEEGWVGELVNGCMNGISKTNFWIFRIFWVTRHERPKVAKKGIVMRLDGPPARTWDRRAPIFLVVDIYWFIGMFAPTKILTRLGPNVSKTKLFLGLLLFFLCGFYTVVAGRWVWLSGLGGWLVGPVLIPAAAAEEATLVQVESSCFHSSHENFHSSHECPLHCPAADAMCTLQCAIGSRWIWIISVLSAVDGGLEWRIHSPLCRREGSHITANFRDFRTPFPFLCPRQQ